MWDDLQRRPGRDDLLRSGEAIAVPHRAAAVPSVLEV